MMFYYKKRLDDIENVSFRKKKMILLLRIKLQVPTQK